MKLIAKIYIHTDENLENYKERFDEFVFIKTEYGYELVKTLMGQFNLTDFKNVFKDVWNEIKLDKKVSKLEGFMNVFSDDGFCVRNEIDEFGEYKSASPNFLLNYSVDDIKKIEQYVRDTYTKKDY